jgi:dienelactone hydrolase
MGRTPSVLDWCDRLAERGFGAVALDFYEGNVATSPGEGRVLRDSANARRPIIRHLIERAYHRMQHDPALLSTQRFLLGWSFGAGWATVASGFLPDVSGVIAYYGEAFSFNPELSDKVQAPMLFIGARGDSDPSQHQLRAIVGELRGKGKTADLFLSLGRHGFAERAHPAHDAGAAAAAWREVTQFLERHTREARF